ncbi:DUF1304 domain-containing protein [Streptomyces sp. TS71-3]|uniref:DUF1304 domain-containing protein n=1 Tax=Streptomyces sp. TS71-3 TaxID=2733862 RepID=UPI001B1FCA10|nr:DUF1304 domain-containing protein [Streptomyces sp. TS71-3]GHJ39973.1 membrane protein [Streptomyces sp. TS71-3]
MPVVGLVFAVLAALIHVYIFVLESLRWTAPKTRAIFGTSEDEALATRQLAFNQGFYNLFLAVMVVVGAAVDIASDATVGRTLVAAGASCMVLAGLVLLLSDRTKVRSALVQLVAPAIALGAWGIGALV